MSWRRLLAVGYALLVEGLDADGRAEINRALNPGFQPTPARPDVRVAATPAEEIAVLVDAEGVVA